MDKIIDMISARVSRAFEAAGYDPALGQVTLSNRPDLCQYQCNGAMAGAKQYHKAPFLIAQAVVDNLAGEEMFSKAEMVKPGFINLDVSGAFLARVMNEMNADERRGVERAEHPLSIVVDYGGPNVAKPLHVGHLRSAVIGESIKRTARFMGHKVVGDVHLGDWGLQIGQIITELKERQPGLPYFDPEITEGYPTEPPFTISDLEEIYPCASKKSKEDEAFKAAAQAATAELQAGRPGYRALWRHIIDVSVADLKREGTPGIVIGEELAKRLGIGLGSRVNLLSPSGEKGATGYSPRIRPFEVVGIFKTGMFEYDATLAFVDLKAARDILGLPDGFLTGIEIMVDDVYKADAIAQSVQDTLGSPFYVRHWMEMNANLFAALKLEKIGMFILLTMVVLIGSFSIVTSLVMLVMEKTRDIAILMSMGATRSMIRRIFMLQGTIIGFVGTLLGYGMGLSLGWALKRYRFIKLPENVYTLDHLPIIITWQDVLIIGASAMLLCFLATLYPARQAARLEPAEALRYE